MCRYGRIGLGRREITVRRIDPEIVIHDLRHGHAALSIAAGVHPRVLQERLGHRDITTTFSVYGGLFPGFDEGVAEALDEAFIASL
jgi:integrase